MKYQEVEIEVVSYCKDIIRTSGEENETERVPFDFADWNIGFIIHKNG